MEQDDGRSFPASSSASLMSSANRRWKPQQGGDKDLSVTMYTSNTRFVQPKGVLRRWPPVVATLNVVDEKRRPEPSKVRAGNVADRWLQAQRHTGVVGQSPATPSSLKEMGAKVPCDQTKQTTAAGVLNIKKKGDSAECTIRGAQTPAGKSKVDVAEKDVHTSPSRRNAKPEAVFRTGDKSVAPTKSLPAASDREACKYRSTKNQPTELKPAKSLRTADEEPCPHVLPTSCFASSLGRDGKTGSRLAHSKSICNSQGSLGPMDIMTEQVPTTTAASTPIRSRSAGRWVQTTNENAQGDGRPSIRVAKSFDSSQKTAPNTQPKTPSKRRDFAAYRFKRRLRSPRQSSQPPVSEPTASSQMKHRDADVQDEEKVTVQDPKHCTTMPPHVSSVSSCERDTSDGYSCPFDESSASVQVDPSHVSAKSSIASTGAKAMPTLPRKKPSPKYIDYGVYLRRAHAKSIRPPVPIEQTNARNALQPETSHPASSADLGLDLVDKKTVKIVREAVTDLGLSKTSFPPETVSPVVAQLDHSESVSSDSKEPSSRQKKLSTKSVMFGDTLVQKMGVCGALLSPKPSPGGDVAPTTLPGTLDRTLEHENLSEPTNEDTNCGLEEEEDSNTLTVSADRHAAEAITPGEPIASEETVLEVAVASASDEGKDNMRLPEIPSRKPCGSSLSAETDSLVQLNGMSFAASDNNAMASFYSPTALDDENLTVDDGKWIDFAPTRGRFETRDAIDSRFSDRRSRARRLATEMIDMRRKQPTSRRRIIRDPETAVSQSIPSPEAPFCHSEHVVNQTNIEVPNRPRVTLFIDSDMIEVCDATSVDTTTRSSSTYSGGEAEPMSLSTVDQVKGPVSCLEIPDAARNEHEASERHSPLPDVSLLDTEEEVTGTESKKHAEDTDHLSLSSSDASKSKHQSPAKTVARDSSRQTISLTPFADPMKDDAAAFGIDEVLENLPSHGTSKWTRDMGVEEVAFEVELIGSWPIHGKAE